MHVYVFLVFTIRKHQKNVNT